MSEDKQQQSQEQVRIIKLEEKIVPKIEFDVNESTPKRVSNANESGPKEGTQSIIRSREDNKNSN